MTYDVLAIGRSSIDLLIDLDKFRTELAAQLAKQSGMGQI